MRTNQQPLHCALLAALPLAFPICASADTYISATAGNGPNGYRSTEVSGNANLFSTPLSLNGFVFKSSSSASEDISQSGFGLDWKISKLAKLGVKHNKVDNGSLDISGNALNLALSLNTLWDSDLLTRVDLKGAESAYKFGDLPVRNDTINQTASSFTLNQDIGSSLTVYGGRDRYSYDRDPVNVAAFLIRTFPRKFVSNSSTLLSFPDTTNRFGVTWQPLEPLSLDVSSSNTMTMLDQKLKTNRLGIDYQLTDHLNISAAVSKVSSTAVVAKRNILRRNGTVLIAAGDPLMAATNDTYSEFSLGWTF